MPEWRVDISQAGVPVPDPVLAGTTSAEPDSAWKLVAGFRPARVIGVELQVVDWGEGSASGYGGTHTQIGTRVEYWQYESHMTANAEATVLSAVIFIPEAMPRLDIYGKAGLAAVNTSLSGTAISRVIQCPPGSVPTNGGTTGPCLSTSDVDESESAPYVGVGVRFATGRSWGLRLEYESIDSDVWSDMTMFSVGIAWER